ncbi:MAG: AAA family ATPase [Armatimonadetes bacterium]|nr:AAA family ATPase [Armatimonadota bacterium]
MKDGIERRLFVAATNQNDGKTTCSLGFVKGFTKIGHSVGFIKPGGQRYMTFEDKSVDEDFLLIHQSCRLRCSLSEVNSVVVTGDFTRRFLDNPDSMYPEMERTVKKCCTLAAKGNDLVVIEGTGHAGVGSIFRLSNARVAALLKAKVVMVTLGGIGRPVDEVAVNRSLFEREGVQVIGVVVNKVIPDKLEEVRDYLTRAFDALGLPLLGVIPYTPPLSYPTVQQIAAATNAEVLNGERSLSNTTARVVVGAMTPPNALKYIEDKTLLVVPGDRDDVVLAVMSMHLLSRDVRLSGVVFTGGIRPQPQTMELLRRTDVPVLAVDSDTYETASAISDILVKIRVSDQEKIELACALVRKYVDFQQLWELLA